MNTLCDVELNDGSDHSSDDSLASGPEYEDDEEHLDASVYGHFSARKGMNVEQWCTCGRCIEMNTEQECTCCRESSRICSMIGTALPCVTEGEMFKAIILTQTGLDYSRYLYSVSIKDDAERERYLQRSVGNKEYRHLAYKSFVNLIGSQFHGKSVRYLLPACVVNTIRQHYPNPEGIPYSGFVCLNSQEAMTLD